MGGSADDGGVKGCREACRFAGTDYSGEQKEILLRAQSINGLLWVSQLCLRTRGQEPSSGVNIKRCWSDITCFKAGGEGNCSCDCAICGSIKKMEFEWRDGVC